MSERYPINVGINFNNIVNQVFYIERSFSDLRILMLVKWLMVIFNVIEFIYQFLRSNVGIDAIILSTFGLKPHAGKMVADFYSATFGCIAIITC